MSTLYITQAGALALQAAGLAGWTNLHIDIATVIPAPPGRLAGFADFTFAAYTGYASQPTVMTGGYVDGPSGKVYADSGSFAFNGPSSGAGVVGTGLVLSDATAGKVWAWAALDSPGVALQVPTDHAVFIIQLFEDETSTITVVA